jgi:hypothetical protein
MSCLFLLHVLNYSLVLCFSSQLNHPFRRYLLSKMAVGFVVVDGPNSRRRQGPADLAAMSQSMSKCNVSISNVTKVRRTMSHDEILLYDMQKTHDLLHDMRLDFGVVAPKWRGSSFIQV